MHSQVPQDWNLWPLPCLPVFELIRHQWMAMKGLFVAVSCQVSTRPGSCSTIIQPMAASLEVRPTGKARAGGTYANRIKSLEVILDDLPKFRFVFEFLKLQTKYARILKNHWLQQNYPPKKGCYSNILQCFFPAQWKDLFLTDDPTSGPQVAGHFRRVGGSQKELSMKICGWTFWFWHTSLYNTSSIQSCCFLERCDHYIII